MEITKGSSSKEPVTHLVVVRTFVDGQVDTTTSHIVRARNLGEAKYIVRSEIGYEESRTMQVRAYNAESLQANIAKQQERAERARDEIEDAEIMIDRYVKLQEQLQ